MATRHFSGCFFWLFFLKAFIHDTSCREFVLGSRARGNCQYKAVYGLAPFLLDTPTAPFYAISRCTLQIDAELACILAIAPLPALERVDAFGQQPLSTAARQQIRLIPTYSNKLQPWLYISRPAHPTLHGHNHRYRNRM